MEKKLQDNERGRLIILQYFFLMKPKRAAIEERQGALFGVELERLIDRSHAPAAIAEKMPWERFDEQFGGFYHATIGRSGVPTRMMVGLHYLKYTFDLSDEEVVERWVENPYWQYFCGEKYFQHEPPIHPTSMTKWRKKIGSGGAEELLRGTITTALEMKVVGEKEFEKLNVDTTVQEKAVTYPTDSKLYHKMRANLVSLAKAHGVPLRQSYVRKGREALLFANRYFFARQTKRARKQVRKLKTYLGRVKRDIERNIAGNEELSRVFAAALALADRVLEQKQSDSNKLYSIHAPEVECIAKGKAHKKYEFGNKVGVVSTSRKGVVLAMTAFHGNPYDGHTLRQSLADAERISEHALNGDVFVDRGYRGHNYNGEASVHIAGKTLPSRTLKRWMKRRAAIEAKIAHLKLNSRLDRNYLLGKEGDRFNAIMCGCGVNLRLIIGAVYPALYFSLFLNLQNALSVLYRRRTPLGATLFLRPRSVPYPLMRFAFS